MHRRLVFYFRKKVPIAPEGEALCRICGLELAEVNFILVQFTTLWAPVYRRIWLSKISTFDTLENAQPLYPASSINFAVSCINA